MSYFSERRDRFESIAARPPRVSWRWLLYTEESIDKVVHWHRPHDELSSLSSIPSITQMSTFGLKTSTPLHVVVEGHRNVIHASVSCGRKRPRHF